MNRFPNEALLAALVLALFGCQDPATSGSSGTGGGSGGASGGTNTVVVYGRVTDTAGSPIQSAKVTIGNLTDYTDASGSFQIASLPSGTQTIQVSAYGFQTYSRQFLAGAPRSFDVQLLKYLTISYPATMDTYVRGGVAYQSEISTNFGSETQLIGTNAQNVFGSIYLQFPQLSIPSGGQLVWVHLLLWEWDAYLGPTLAGDFNLRVPQSNWGEYSVTYSNQPLLSSPVTIPLLSYKVNGWWIFDLTSVFDQGGSTISDYGLVAYPSFNSVSSGWNGIYFRSREYGASFAPTIEMEYLK